MLTIEDEEGRFIKCRASMLYWARELGRMAANEEDTTFYDAADNHTWIARLCDMQERIEGGNFIAIIDAIRICDEQQVVLPAWLQEAISLFMASALAGNSGGSRGRSNSPLARAREQLKLVVRAETVRRIRMAQHYAGKSETLAGIYALAMPNTDKHRLATDPDADLGITVEDAISLAERSLRATFAQGSAETIRKAFRSPKADTAWWQMELSSETLALVGLDGLGAYGDEAPTPWGSFAVTSIDDLVEEVPE